MSLTTLHWRELPTQTVSTATSAAFLDAINTALASTTYADGSARTPGSTYAWSASKGGSPTESVVCTDPSAEVNNKIIFAAKSSATTPKMLSPDTFLASALHVGLGSDGGSVTTWDGSGTSDPLGSGNRWSGYVRCSAACTGGAGFVTLAEGAEGLSIDVKIGSSWYGALVGALFEPSSTASSRCEADGRVYGILTSGSTAIDTSFESNASAFSVGHGASAGNAHAFYQLPRTSTWRAIQRIGYRNGLAGSGTLKAADGAFVLPDIHFEDKTSGNWIGALREVCRGPQRRVWSNLNDAGQLYAHVIGGADGADCDVLYLLR